jgi:N-acetylneuraminic acid mutarotase
VIVLSKITSIANADPNANGTAIPMGTARPIGQFKFTAATANNIYNGSNKAMFDGLIFNVNATNIDLDGSSFKVFNKADPTMTSTCAVSQTSGSSALVVTCNNMSSFIDSQIDPGSDMTLVLRADVQNAKVNSANTSTLQTSLQNFTNMSATPFSPVGSHVKFFDKDAASFVQFLWIEYPDTSVNSTSYSE